MRRIERLGFPVILGVIFLMLSMTSCATKIEYVRDIPAVTFPVFPPADCVEYDEETDRVTMPLWYWREIAEYKIDVDAACNYLDNLREVEAEKEKELKEK